MPKKKPAKSPAEKPSEGPRFEEALERLEAIVHRLEEGDLGLDEALKQYEEGVGLLRRSYELLKQAERRIEVLSGVDAEGNPIAEPFDNQATIAGGGPGRGSRAGESDPSGGSGSRRSSASPQGPPPSETDVDSDPGLF
jgi:exodeoxyribonuclease VII small subunit